MTKDRAAMIEAARRVYAEWLGNGDDLRDFHEVLADFALAQTANLREQLRVARTERDAAVEAFRARVVEALEAIWSDADAMYNKAMADCIDIVKELSAREALEKAG